MRRTIFIFIVLLVGVSAIAACTPDEQRQSDEWIVDPVEEPYLEEPYLEEPYVEEPYVEEPYVEEPYVEEPYVEEPYDPVPSQCTPDYPGDVACGYVPDDPVPGKCTPDYPGDAACQTNEDLLNDMADLNSDRIN